MSIREKADEGGRSCASAGFSAALIGMPAVNPAADSAKRKSLIRAGLSRDEALETIRK